MKTKTWLWFGGIIGVAFIIYIIWTAAGNSQNCATAPVTEINIGDHKNILSHIHQTLTITVNGEQIIIPANIGILSGIMRPIHTHDSSGKIHVEGPCQRDFTLEEFFDLWGQTFTEDCIMENCIDETHTLKMYVNGVETTLFGDYILKADDEIEIIYEETT
ncbi:MAG: hypothetical protein Q8R18_05725 [bacterium]|nr:hypothetical protein [bacterium]